MSKLVTLTIVSILFLFVAVGLVPGFTAAQENSPTPILFIGTCLVPGTNTFRWQGLNGPVAAEWRLHLQPAGPDINLGMLAPGEIVGGYTANILTTTTEGTWKKQYFNGTTWISAIGENFTSVNEHTRLGLFCPNFPTPTPTATPTATPVTDDGGSGGDGGSDRIPTPTPTVTVTPTPSATPTVDQGRGDETDCCPGIDEVQPTPKVEKTGAVKGIKTTAASVVAVAPLKKFPSSGFSPFEFITSLFGW